MVSSVWASRIYELIRVQNSIREGRMIYMFACEGEGGFYRARRVEWLKGERRAIMDVGKKSCGIQGMRESS